MRHARVVGNSDQCDRLCRLHRHRDLSPIAKQQIAGSLSAKPSGVSLPASIGLVRFARGADERVGLDQRMTAVGLRPQADHHDAPVSRFVRVAKRSTACFPESRPYRNLGYTQRDLGFNLTG